MKIAVLQYDVVWCNADANRRKAEHAIARMPDSDLYVLPEMFTTGFVMNPEGIAEEAGGPTLQWMRQTASKTGAALCGSVAVTEHGRFYNRLYFVKPDGSAVSYDKHHLFTYGGETKRYQAGTRRVIVEWKGMRFLLQICYDLRFPVFSRNRGDYDAILYVANWPSSRKNVWQTLLRARAIENQSFVVGANRTGCDPACPYCGLSAIVDAYGRTLAEAGETSEETIAATFDLERLRHFRHKFPVLGDADSFKL